MLVPPPAPLVPPPVPPNPPAKPEMFSLRRVRLYEPLALALGAGAELLQPLAIAVIGGLTVALLLSLIVTPTVYSLIRREPASQS